MPGQINFPDNLIPRYMQGYTHSAPCRVSNFVIMPTARGMAENFCSKFPVKLALNYSALMATLNSGLNNIVCVTGGT